MRRGEIYFKNVMVKIFRHVDKGKIPEAQKMVDKFIADLDSPNKEVRKEVADG